MSELTVNRVLEKQGVKASSVGFNWIKDGFREGGILKIDLQEFAYEDHLEQQSTYQHLRTYRCFNWSVLPV
jgi:hypothetical protein